MITSAVKGEGKSVIAANLAYALARDMGKRTLLIDGDLKCPMVHQYMGIPHSPGLRDVLEGGRPVDSCLYREGDLPLWILPSALERGQMLDLSHVQKIAGMLTDLRGQYDHIIIDAPPILPLADMHILSSMADILVLVIRAGLTPRGIVENAAHELSATSNIAIILNGIDSAAVPYYMQEGYQYVVGNKGASFTK
jgi:Mrp family chromosome partitioning ATPase